MDNLVRSKVSLEKRVSVNKIVETVSEKGSPVIERRRLQVGTSYGISGPLRRYDGISKNKAITTGHLGRG